MIQASAETVLHFLDIFEGILFIALLVTVIICTLCVIKAVKATRKSSGYPHKNVLSPGRQSSRAGNQVFR